MLDRNTIKKCREFIHMKFKIDDLKFCLQVIGCNTSGKKDELQRRLSRALDCAKTQNDTVSVVLERGNASLDILNTSKSLYIEEESFERQVDTTELINCCFHTCDIEMKKLYFHRNISKVTSWIIPIYEGPYSILNFGFVTPRLMTPQLFIPKESNTPQMHLLLRSTNLSRSNYKCEFQDSYPVEMKMYTRHGNYTNLLPREVYCSQVKKKIRLSVPTLLNEYILENYLYVDCEFSLKFMFSYDTKFNVDDMFAFALFTSTPVSVKEICDEILNREKFDFNKFSQDLNKFMSKSSGVQLEFARISLQSSITRKRINIPFRGRYCTHLNPDDLEDYITSNINNESWKCKICKALCTPDDIFIDEFYMDVLGKHKNAESIELYPDMSYRLLDQDGKDCSEKFKSVQKEKTNDEIIVIDSDDEKDFCQQPLLIKKETIESEKVNSANIVNDTPAEIPQKQIDYIVIDDSSDEEEPSRKKAKSIDKTISKSSTCKQTYLSNTSITIINSQSSSDSFTSDDSSNCDVSFTHINSTLDAVL